MASLNFTACGEPGCLKTESPNVSEEQGTAVFFWKPQTSNQTSQSNKFYSFSHSLTSLSGHRAGMLFQVSTTCPSLPSVKTRGLRSYILRSYSRLWSPINDLKKMCLVRRQTHSQMLNTSCHFPRLCEQQYSKKQLEPFSLPTYLCSCC